MENVEIKDLKILIVDSNTFIAKTLYSILEAFGVRKIMLCNTLEQAEKKYYNSEIDCIFVDFMMEDKSGLEFIKTIRTKESSKNDQDLPIILDTGVTDLKTIVKARDAGVTEVIGKPFSPDQVLLKLNNAINNKRDFINSGEFTGPNRRRQRKHITDWEGESDRRGSAGNIQEK
ncbi:MAG: response regulator [Emcibacteraceae bacterium]|nr:response regulator [Emcibacteraceae bacterium]